MGQWTFWYSRPAMAFHHKDGGVVFAVAPNKVLAFAKGTFSHTSHRF